MEKGFTLTNGRWEKELPAKDETFFEIQPGGEFIGLLVSKNESTFYPGSMYYVFETPEGDIKKHDGSTNLDKWMEKRESGDVVRIRRLNDRPMPPPNKPMKVFEVEVWRKNK